MIDHGSACIASVLSGILLLCESSSWDQRDRRQSREGSGERAGNRASFKICAICGSLHPSHSWFSGDPLLLFVTSVACVVKTKAEKIVRIFLEPGRANQIQAWGCAAGQGRDREYAKPR